MATGTDSASVPQNPAYKPPHRRTSNYQEFYLQRRNTIGSINEVGPAMGSMSERLRCGRA